MKRVSSFGQSILPKREINTGPSCVWEDGKEGNGGRGYGIGGGSSGQTVGIVVIVAQHNPCGYIGKVG